MMKKPIAILGGTFDPIHYGHLRTGLEIYQQYEIQEVRLLPCQQPVLKNGTLATAAQRLSMLHLAVKNEFALKIDERELHRATPSYTFDTLVSLRDELEDTPIWLILGSDIFEHFTKWYRFNELIHLAHFFVVKRPGFVLPNNDEITQLFQTHQCDDISLLKNQAAGKIITVELTPLSISATAIREQIQKQLSPRYLLPDSVLDYIHQHNLYQKHS
jgi:nicotinate-nucleotide adenylyltransferase